MFNVRDDFQFRMYWQKGYTAVSVTKEADESRKSFRGSNVARPWMYKNFWKDAEREGRLSAELFH